MNVENWTEGQFPATNRTVAVATFPDRQLWQLIDLIDERRGVDPEEIAATLKGFAWEDVNVELKIYWKGSRDFCSTFEASYGAGELTIDFQEPQDFALKSYGLRGAYADCCHDGSAELYDDSLRSIKWTPADN